MVGALWRSTDTLEHVGCCLQAFDFSSGGVLPCFKHVCQMVSWHALACLIDGLLTCFGMFAQTLLTDGFAMLLPCLLKHFWQAVLLCFDLFWFEYRKCFRWQTAMFWHVLVCLVCLVPGAILTCCGMFAACLCTVCEWYFARLCVNDILHGSVWVMPGAMTGSASILWAKKRIDEKRETCAAVSDCFTSGAGWQPSPENLHRHVMVGITRSKVFFLLRGSFYAVLVWDEKIIPEWSSRLWITRSRRPICFRIRFSFGWPLKLNILVFLTNLDCSLRVGSADWRANCLDTVQYWWDPERFTSFCQRFLSELGKPCLWL